MAEHTPTPWGADKFGSVRAEAGQGDVIAMVCTPCGVDEERWERGQVNAAFIVRACNAHDELVATLEDVQRLLAAQPHGQVTRVYARVKAALAKAKGELS